MCAEKAKEKSTNTPAGSQNGTQVDETVETAGTTPAPEQNELLSAPVKTDNDAAGKLRKLFSAQDGARTPEHKSAAGETSQQLPAMQAPARKGDPDSTLNTLPAMGKNGVAENKSAVANSKPTNSQNKIPAQATGRATQNKLPAAQSSRATQNKLPAAQSQRATQNKLPAAQQGGRATQNKLQAQSKTSQNALPAVPISATEKAVAQTKSQRKSAVRSNAKDLSQCVTRRTLDGLWTSTFVVIDGNELLRAFVAAPRKRVEPAPRKIPENFLELDLKNFKGHVFLRKESLQEFAYRIHEVTKDWEDFRFVDPADDVEWHRSSLNQALNDFMSGLALPPVTLALDEKARDTIEPQYAAGTGTIIVRPDDIRSALTVDVAAVYHDLLHAEQDATIVRRIALTTNLNKPSAINSAEIMGEYCRQTGLDPASVSRDWIHAILQASTEWLKQKSDEIKRLQKKTLSGAFDEAFGRDRELVRAKELTDALYERSMMFKHLTRKHQLLVYMHREFTQNLEPHVYVERFESSATFQRMLLGYDWNNLSTCKKEEFAEILAAQPDLLRAILFRREEEWLPKLPRHLSIRGFEPLAIIKVRALARAFDLEVADKIDADEIKRFDQKYREVTRRIASEVEDEFAEQIRLQRVKHYLGVEQELEANHAAFMINRQYGQDRDSVRLNSSTERDEADGLLNSLNELNEKLPAPAPAVPQQETSNAEPATAPARPMFESRTAPDVVIAKNKRVTYRGCTWMVADFNQDTGDVVLHRSEERTMDANDVFMGARNLSINESYRITVGEGHDDGWFYRGRDEAGKLRMYKPNAERIEVPKLALQSVNQLLANARAAASVSMTNLPRIEFPKADGTPAPVTPKRHDMTWTGSHLGSYLIEELISDRQLYWIYRGIDQNTLEHKIFKVAKPPEYLTDVTSVDPLKSTVLKLTSVGFAAVTPNVSDLLRLQCERMSHDRDLIMARIEEVSCTDALSYSRMEHIEGVSLRELRKHGPIDIELALDIVTALETIQKNPMIAYHGDLTPDNIMWSYSTVKLIDAGYFGAFDSSDGTVEDGAITTPAYYPFLTPNDMLALGIIFWEMHFGHNPFATFEELPATMPGVSQALLRVLKGYSSIGRPFVNAMALVKPPRTLEPDIHPELGRFLLACLGLRINDKNELDPAARYETFTQMAEAIVTLGEQGITEL